MVNKKVYEDAKKEFLDMSINDRAKWYDKLVESCGQDFSDKFLDFCAGAIDFSEFESQVAEFEEGKVEEGGTTREEGFERDCADIAESMAEDDCCPVKETLMRMSEEYNALPEEKKDEVIEVISKAKGEEFSEKVRDLLEDLDFSQYIAGETQVFYDVLNKNFSESNNKMGFLKGIGDFSESVVSYASGIKPSNFSILESAIYLYDVAVKNFSENGELADALQELSDGALTPPEAQKMADNIEACAEPEVKEELVDAAKTDDAVETVANDMSEEEDEEEEAKERTVVREREQNNEMFDALIERYKGLQTDSAREEFKNDLVKFFPEETVKYILDRAKGEDFSEDEKEEKSVAEEAPKSEAGAEVPELHMADVNKYEELSQKLLGSDAYTVSPAAAEMAAVSSPSLGGTLPEGPVVMGGTTMGEQYQRDSIEEEYKAMGLI